MRGLLFPVLLAGLAACARAPETESAQKAAESPGLASSIQVADAKAASQLLTGWHGVEQGTWRWTERRFSVALRPPVRGQAAALELKFSLPEVLIQRLRSVTVSATVNGAALPPETYAQPGSHVYTRQVPAQALAGDTARVDFELDKALGPDQSDLRELGVVVTSVALR